MKRFLIFLIAVAGCSSASSQGLVLNAGDVVSVQFPALTLISTMNGYSIPYDFVAVEFVPGSVQPGDRMRVDVFIAGPAGPITSCTMDVPPSGAFSCNTPQPLGAAGGVQLSMLAGSVAVARVSQGYIQVAGTVFPPFYVTSEYQTEVTYAIVPEPRVSTLAFLALCVCVGIWIGPKLRPQHGHG